MTPQPDPVDIEAIRADIRRVCKTYGDATSPMIMDLSATCDEVESLRELVNKQGSLILRSYKLIVAGILTEEGGDPDAGIDWVNDVDAFNSRPVKPVGPTKG